MISRRPEVEEAGAAGGIVRPRGRLAGRGGWARKRGSALPTGINFPR